MRGDLFKAVVMGVAFLDVLSSMTDPDLPLTVHEYDEWGNPALSPDAYHSILSYDPYYNLPTFPVVPADKLVIEKKKYPDMLLTASMLDNRVPYWQPFKWVARLRRYYDLRSKAEQEKGQQGGEAKLGWWKKSKQQKKEDMKPLILLSIDSETGHHGDTGLYNYFKTAATQLAFLIKCVSKNK